MLTAETEADLKKMMHELDRELTAHGMKRKQDTGDAGSQHPTAREPRGTRRTGT